MERNIYKIGKELFITSNEEIKEGEWSLYENEVKKTTKETLAYIESSGDDEFKKIILTTDQDLDGVQAIDNEFLEWFVKNPSCERVEVTKVADLDLYYKNGIGGQKYKIIIPKQYFKQLNSEDFGIPKIGTKEFNNLASGLFGGNPRLNEEPKQETLEEVLLEIGKTPMTFEPKLTPEFQEVIDFNDKIYNQETLEEAFKFWSDRMSSYDKLDVLRFGAVWQQEQDKNKYSDEDLREAFEAGHKKGFSGYPNTENWKELPFEKWFEQIKKK